MLYPSHEDQISKVLYPQLMRAVIFGLVLRTFGVAHAQRETAGGLQAN